MLNGLPVIVQHCTTISKLAADIDVMAGVGVKKARHPALWLFHQKVCPFLRIYFGEDLGTYLCTCRNATVPYLLLLVAARCSA